MTLRPSKRIAISWEDRYWAPLHRLLVMRRDAHRPAGSTVNIDFVSDTVRGNGNFASYAANDWPTAHVHGTLKSPGAIDHVICVADADKISGPIPTISKPPAAASLVPAWLDSAEAAFTSHLRAKAAQPSTVHGILLRWAKESLTLAAYDQRIIEDKLGLEVQHAAVQRYLAACAPSPLSVADDVFTDTFRRPVPCIDALLKAQGLTPVGKGSSLDDVIGGLTTSEVVAVCQRVPDVDRVLALAWRLATAAPIAAGAGTLVPAGGKGKAKRAK